MYVAVVYSKRLTNRVCGLPFPHQRAYLADQFLHFFFRPAFHTILLGYGPDFPIRTLLHFHHIPRADKPGEHVFELPEAREHAVEMLV